MVKLNKIIFVCLSFILASIFINAYYISFDKFFQDGINNDGASGLALQRASNGFVNDGCGSGTILDVTTGLCWDKNMNRWGLRNWGSQDANCNALVLGGHSDWRLPKLNEAMSILDEIGGIGSTCTTLSSFGFINCQDSIYWLKDTYVGTGDGWMIDIRDGETYWSLKMNTGYPFCVRVDY